MGSTGSGSFSDYPGTNAKKVGGGGGGSSGGTSGTDRCTQAFQVLLEEVGNSDFYSRFKDVPPFRGQLEISFDGKRLFAVDLNGVKVGALPTSFNYLVACLAEGVAYDGLVSSSALSPFPTVSADFVPR